VILAGRLEHFELGVLLQTLAVNRSTGRLILTHGGGQAVLVFREGRITYAATGSARETFGSILLLRGLITEADLQEALARQGTAAEPRRLGRVLVEMGSLDERALREVMQQQTREVLQERQGWRTGAFQFEPLDIAGDGEVEVPPVTAALNLDMPPADRLTPPQGTSRTSLATIASETASPPFTAEITLRLMRGAAQVLNRGVLFLVGLEEVRGMGQFGINLPGRFAVEAVRDTAIPLGEPSVFRQVVEQRETYRGPLPPTPWNRHLVERLGGLRPPEVAVMPLVVAGTVRLVFYGDNLPDTRDLGLLGGLEDAVAEVALAMERGLLDRRENFDDRWQPS
jgi:hypothetical protein